MSAIVTCPECRRALQVPDNLIGQTVRCPDCKHAFTAQAPEPAIQVTPSPAPPAPVKPTWDEPPPPERQRGRRERDDDDDDLDDYDDLRVDKRNSSLNPDRGGVILALGIVSLVLAFFSFML